MSFNISNFASRWNWGGGVEDEDTGFCVLLPLQRMGEEHLMLQSQKVKVENFKTSLKIDTCFKKLKV